MLKDASQYWLPSFAVMKVMDVAPVLYLKFGLPDRISPYELGSVVVK